MNAALTLRPTTPHERALRDALEHEVNGLLAVVLSSLPVGLSALSPEDTAALVDAREAMVRLRELMDELLLLTSPYTLPDHELDLAVYIERRALQLSDLRGLPVRLELKPWRLRAEPALLGFLDRLLFTTMVRPARVDTAPSVTLAGCAFDGRYELVLTSSATRLPQSLHSNLGEVLRGAPLSLAPSGELLAALARDAELDFELVTSAEGLVARVRTRAPEEA